MSNSIVIGHSLAHKSFLAATVREHQSKMNSSCIAARNYTNTLFRAQQYPTSKSPLTTKFWCNTLNVKSPMGTRRLGSVFPRAALSDDPSSERLAGEFNLGGETKLEVDVSAPTPGSALQIDIQVTNYSGRLLLHWGAIRNGNDKWVLPTRRPEGTRVYKNKALRTPLVNSGTKSFLKIEIDDPAIRAIEFLLVDQEQNKWFRNGGENFHVELPMKDKMKANISIPEDLVQIQAYIRWERKGKQMYTPEKEKEEYEAARHELWEEIARGTSVQDLRARLTNKNDTSGRIEQLLSETKNQIPEDLVKIHAYIRWEKAGKPKNSPDQQLKELEEARKELQIELEKGTSLDEIEKKITREYYLKEGTLPSLQLVRKLFGGQYVIPSEEFTNETAAHEVKVLMEKLIAKEAETATLTKKSLSYLQQIRKLEKDVKTWKQEAAKAILDYENMKVTVVSAENRAQEAEKKAAIIAAKNDGGGINTAVTGQPASTNIGGGDGGKATSGQNVGSGASTVVPGQPASTSTSGFWDDRKVASGQDVGGGTSTVATGPSAGRGTSTGTDAGVRPSSTDTGGGDGASVVPK